MKNYLIRDFKKEDYQSVIKIWEETKISSPQRGDNQDLILKTIQNGARLIILQRESDKKMIGTCWITHDNRRAYIHHLAILKDFQNIGLGKKLFKEAINISKEMGLQPKLEVHQTNQKAINIYKSFGLKDLGGYLVMIKRD